VEKKVKDLILQQEARDFDQIYKERAQGLGSILVGTDQRVEDYFYKNPWRYDFSRQYAFGSILKDFAEFMADRKGLNILEIGCGNGWFSLNANIKNINHWDCIDISHKGVVMAEEQKHKLGVTKNSYFCASVEEYKTTKKFDVITCVNTLHHMRDLENFFKKVKAHLKPGGRVFIHDVTSDLFSETNGAFVLLLRTIFNLNDKIKYFEGFKSASLSKRLEEIVYEWQQETDKGKQSCCDHFLSSKELKAVLDRKFRRISYKEEGGILMRFLGGLRGEKQALREIAKELIDLEELFLLKKIITPYTYTFIGKLK
jgi:2-polyprenyl-3-methyl-5-hydroxy-6-metoxy-1,4-benzoquinol methylase